MDKRNEIVPKKKAGRPKGSLNKSVAFKQATKESLVKALTKSRGIIAPAIKAVGVDRTTFIKYYEEDLDFRKAVDDVREGAIDFVESQLLKQIENGNPVPIIFYLKTKGASRGYVEQNNTNLTIEQVRIRYIVPENNEKQFVPTEEEPKKLDQSNE